MTTIATKPLKTDVMYINAEPMGFKLVNRLICNLSQGQRKDKEDQTDTLLYMPSVSLFVALRQTSEEESPTKAVCLPSGYFFLFFLSACSHHFVDFVKANFLSSSASHHSRVHRCDEQQKHQCRQSSSTSLRYTSNHSVHCCTSRHC